ncbi:hypothetical protein Pcinc_024377 [Petrolisthes cinctipes]|uniref:Uncharacterized protein n=1 Tax=Petrolisthes cinctipes TaxID=88211 RepID=A0AAE1FC65_PETCI|nr:hypothetical protein Pcinc_024377 [Petrolisthes cinctipes]
MRLCVSTRSALPRHRAVTSQAPPKVALPTVPHSYFKCNFRDQRCDTLYLQRSYVVRPCGGPRCSWDPQDGTGQPPTTSPGLVALI